MNPEQFASRGLKAQRAVDEVLNNLPAADPTAGVAARQGAGGDDDSTPRLKSLNSMPLINRTHVRNFLLEHARATRPHNKFNRVSEETLRDIHEAVRQMLIARVHRTPSKGRTM
jgi:hypothetical protein